MTELNYRGAKTINYKQADFADLKYIKIIYKDIEGEAHELKTEINFLSDDYLSLYVKRIIKKEQLEPEEETQEDQEEDAVSSYAESYLKKLAEIRTIKERAEATGNFSEYYRKLAEISTMRTDEPETCKEREEVQEEKTEEIQAEDNSEKEETQEKSEENKEEESKEEESKEFEIECPQQILVKFIIEDLLYVAEATLQEVNVRRPRVYFKIKAPEILNFQQHRRFYRIDLKRLCLLIVTNKEGNSTAFIAKSINLSAGGVLINRLETLTEDNKYVRINHEEYENFNLVIVLEPDKVLKLSARYVREEEGKKSWKYGFEFTDMPQEKTDYINKYVIGKQIDGLREEFNMKNKNFHTKHKGIKEK